MGINVINKENKLFVSIDKKISNKEFFLLLKERLARMFLLNQNIKKEMVLNIESREMSSKEILELFDILDSENKCLISKIICQRKIKEEITVIKGDIRSGENRKVFNSLLLIGNVNKGAKLIVEGNLYVLGRINGDIELLESNNKIYCESIYNSLVKIGSKYKIYTYELTDQVIESDDVNIINKKYRKEGNYCGKSNCSYIW